LIRFEKKGAGFRYEMSDLFYMYFHKHPPKSRWNITASV